MTASAEDSPAGSPTTLSARAAQRGVAGAAGGEPWCLGEAGAGGEDGGHELAGSPALITIARIASRLAAAQAGFLARLDATGAHDGDG